MLEDIEYILGQEEEFGLKAISLVDTPATGQKLIMLKDETPIYLAKDADRQLLVGALLIPEQRIYRRRDDGTEFNMYVGQQTINDIAKRYMSEGLQNEFTLQHKDNLVNLSVQELWLVQDSKIDKSALYGFEYPKGTLMAITHVSDKVQWEAIKESNITGYSIEALLQPKEVELSVMDMLAKMKLS